ncbi:hypothetical protein ADUPG1_012059, partial [Aduncisulcus paluster]
LNFFEKDHIKELKSSSSSLKHRGKKQHDHSSSSLSYEGRKRGVGYGVGEDKQTEKELVSGWLVVNAGKGSGGVGFGEYLWRNGRKFGWCYDETKLKDAMDRRQRRILEAEICQLEDEKVIQDEIQESKYQFDRMVKESRAGETVLTLPKQHQYSDDISQDDDKYEDAELALGTIPEEFHEHRGQIPSSKSARVPSSTRIIDHEYEKARALTSRDHKDESGHTPIKIKESDATHAFSSEEKEERFSMLDDSENANEFLEGGNSGRFERNGRFYERTGMPVIDAEEEEEESTSDVSSSNDIEIDHSNTTVHYSRK